MDLKRLTITVASDEAGRSIMYKIKILKPAWDDLERIGDLHYSLSGQKTAKKVTDGRTNYPQILKTKN